MLMFNHTRLFLLKIRNRLSSLEDKELRKVLYIEKSNINKILELDIEKSNINKILDVMQESRRDKSLALSL